MTLIENPAIEIQGLECRYGRLKAVQNATLQVPQGCIYALLGTNGAGKSTLIKTLLNLVSPARGNSWILGKPSPKIGPQEWAQIGYVSESQRLPDSLTLAELIAYCRALYPTWDDGFCEDLQTMFALPATRKLREFSRGMKLKAALLVSLAYRPSILILDEPFGGLDALTREELIQGILELSDGENWTMFLSTHDLEEVERLADWVGIIDRGVLHLSEPLETLQARFRRINVSVRGEARLPDPFPETCLLPETGGSTIRWVESNYAGETAMSSEIGRLFPGHEAFTATPLSLREILIAFTRALRLKPLTTP